MSLDINYKITAIIKKLEKYKMSYVDANESTDKIYNLWVNDILFEPETSTEYLYVGVYFHCVLNDDLSAMKYCEVAVEKGNVHAMNNLGTYYAMVKNYAEMKKYFEMAIGAGHSIAMANMRVYYCEIEKNYEEMEKYYMMAIGGGNFTVVDNLVRYYEKNELYYKIIELGIKYSGNVSREKVVDSFNKLDVGGNNEDDKFLDLVSKFKFCEGDKVNRAVLLLQRVMSEKIDLLKLHFEYAVGSEGFMEARSDFIGRVLV